MMPVYGCYLCRRTYEAPARIEHACFGVAPGASA